MRNKKVIPDFKHIPEAPINKAKSADETAIEMLTIIRKHEPEDQNAIVTTLLKDLAVDRWNSVKSGRDATMRAEKSAEVFFTLCRALEEVVKETQSR